ncbi:hypothetical protein L211DRAFT_835022 [Terfezia boudieri ATCC MYA-4762]|uniref:Uncharacterized protein n=1 Tax=Terfezia boudieri ATCC MYA-4762 TaxID=1051890 RepID=A0A3N4LYD7_9PEZI|nr:hypothetical protein L211DRAFT_835022 [Terfezia boudieri ATCC MYA-4762]
MLKAVEGSPNIIGANPVEDNLVRDSWAQLLRWEQAESYSMDNDELDQYAKELAQDLKKAEETHLIPCGYFEEGSPTLPDTESQEKGVPTMLAENDLGEDGHTGK